MVGDLIGLGYKYDENDWWLYNARYSSIHLNKKDDSWRIQIRRTKEASTYKYNIGWYR